jgi:hypothetical protein
MAFFKFIRSPGFKKATQKLSSAYHNLELSLPSTLTKTPEVRIGPIRLGNQLRLTLSSGGLPGRIFEIRYSIGKNASPGAGSFLFRVDY